MPPGANTVTRVVVKEIGKRLPKLAAKKAGSRFVGHMSRGSPAWGKAFQHIRAHFRPAAGKQVHAVFAKKFRNETALKMLIRKAAENPSRAPVLTRLTIGGESIGRPAVVLERQFREVIGTVGDEACHVLRIVIDYTGRPITAYPVKSMLGSGRATKTASGVAGAVVVSGVSRPAAADNPLETYATLLAAERSLYAERIDDACSPGDALGWVIDFLVAPSCIAPDPHELIRRSEVEARATAIRRTLERRFGVTLDQRTAQNVRSDVIAAWSMGYRMQ